jgi:pyruvate-formate lyase
MSLGRVDAFLDGYIEADLAAGRITEEEAQELIDQVGAPLCFFRFRFKFTFKCVGAGGTGRKGFMCW